MLEISDVHDLCQRISDENDSKKAEQLMFALRGVLQSNPSSYTLGWNTLLDIGPRS